MGGTRNERKKWGHFFNNINIILFVTALKSYNSVLGEDEWYA